MRPAEVASETRSPVATPSFPAAAGDSSAQGIQERLETASGTSRRHGRSAPRPSPRKAVGKVIKATATPAAGAGARHDALPTARRGREWPPPASRRYDQ